ncbi:unnamed protein product [Lampetra planeri]
MSFIIKRMSRDKGKGKEVLSTRSPARSARQPSRNHARAETPPPPSRDALSAISGAMEGAGVRTGALRRPPPTLAEPQHFGDLGHASLRAVAAATSPGDEEGPHSRLSRTLGEALRDSAALPHLLLDLEARGALHLARFWLDAEAFRQESWARVRTRSLDAVKLSSLAARTSPLPARGSPLLAATATDRSPAGRNFPAGESPATSAPSPSAPAGPGDVRVAPPRELCGCGSAPSCPFCGGGGGTAGPDRPRRRGRSLLDGDGGGGGVGVRSGDACGRDGAEEGRRPARAVPDGLTLPSATAEGCDSISDKLMKSIERDAVELFTRFVSQDAEVALPISDAMRNLIIAKICGEDGDVDPNCFLPAQELVFHELETQFFPLFLESSHFCRYQMEVLTSGSVCLGDILTSEGTLFYFSEFMEKEDAAALLQFWLVAHDFQAQLAGKAGQYDGQEAQNDAMILYDKYFSLQATCPLGFGDSVRPEVESNICREGGPLPDCFSTALRQAYTTMEAVYLPGFLCSDIYYKYLSELLYSVRSEEAQGPSAHVPGRGGAPPPSEAVGNERGNQANSNKKNLVKILKNFDEDITIDAKSLEPESLYYRHYAGKMSFGRINNLGQFVKESEPNPDGKKPKGSLSQVMKRWVQGTTDEAQEDMAWRVARMIVGEIVRQSATLRPPAPPPVPSGAAEAPGRDPATSGGMAEPGATIVQRAEPPARCRPSPESSGARPSHGLRAAAVAAATPGPRAANK